MQFYIRKHIFDRYFNLVMIFGTIITQNLKIILKHNHFKYTLNSGIIHLINSKVVSAIFFFLVHYYLHAYYQAVKVKA